MDTTPSALMLINRSTPAGQYTNASNVTFLATFSEKVTGVVAKDFSLAGTATLGYLGRNQHPATSDGGLTWSIPVRHISSSANGTVQLNLSNSTGGFFRTATCSPSPHPPTTRATRWIIGPPR